MVEFFWSAGFAAVFVIAVHAMGQWRPVQHLMDAIEQGISFLFFDVLGCLALFAFGVALLWPRWHLPTTAHSLLTTTYGAGTVAFGLLLGQFLVAIWTADSQSWWTWVSGLFVGLSFPVVAGLILIVRYLALLVSPESRDEGFLARWADRPFSSRALVATVISFLPIALLLQKH
jgi:hypothetical protein